MGSLVEVSTTASVFESLKRELEHSVCMESLVVTRRADNKKQESTHFNTAEYIAETVGWCKKARIDAMGNDQRIVTDEELHSAAAFTDGIALEPYKLYLDLVPRLVNVVTVRRHFQHATHPGQCRDTLRRLLAVSRGVAMPWRNVETPPEPRSDRGKVHRVLLCSKAVRRGAVGL